MAALKQMLGKEKKTSRFACDQIKLSQHWIKGHACQFIVYTIKSLFWDWPVIEMIVAGAEKLQNKDNGSDKKKQLSFSLIYD